MVQHTGKRLSSTKKGLKRKVSKSGGTRVPQPEKANATSFKKGHKKLPGAAPRQEHRGFAEKTNKFIDDMFTVYGQLGGDKGLLAHVRGDEKLREKFYAKMIQITTKVLDREAKISLEVTGGLEHTHIHRYGFSPESVAVMMEGIKAGTIDVGDFAGEGVPELPEGEVLPVLRNVTPVKDA